MIEHSLDIEHSILFLRPQGALSADDFVQVANEIDPYIERVGGLRGLIIDAAIFPGWDGLGALMSHLRFVKEHHKHIKKVALVTDSVLGGVAKQLASHFVSADIRHFAAADLDIAKEWVMGLDE